MDDKDVTSRMSAQVWSDFMSDFMALPFMLTVQQAADVLGIRRTLAYKLAKRYENTGGAEGMPCVWIDGARRVLRAALLEWILRGCTGGSPASVRDELVSRRRPCGDDGGRPGAGPPSADGPSADGPSADARPTVRCGGESSGGRRREPGGPPPPQLPRDPAG
jgi:hypothetical protein